MTATFVGIAQTPDIDEAMKVARKCIADGCAFYCRRVEFYDVQTATFGEVVRMAREHAPVEYEVYADRTSVFKRLVKEADILRLKEIRGKVFDLLCEAHGIAEQYHLGEKAETWYSGIVVQLGVDYADATDFRDHPTMHTITDTIDELEDKEDDE